VPQIHIRRFLPMDLPALAMIDHNSTTEFVWQMDIQQGEDEITVGFRERRLPRVVRQIYPRDHGKLAENWQDRWGILVGVVGEENDRNPTGYIAMAQGHAPDVARITDLAVATPVRRQGMASALVLSAEDWAVSQRCARLLMEVQSKNFPAIRMAQKLGYEFCGYNDRYFPNKDIALFFDKSLL